MHDALPAEEDAARPYRGFMVHAWTDRKRDRMYITGRLLDGRSFAAVQPLENPSFHVYASDLDRARVLLERIPAGVLPPDLASFEGRENLARLAFADGNSRNTARSILEQAGLYSPDGGEKPHLAWLSRRGIRGPVEIRGAARGGRFLDMVFPAAEIAAFSGAVPVPLKIASIDIETDTKDDSIRAIAISVSDASFAETQTRVRLRAAPGMRENTAGSDTAGDEPALFRHADERALLKAFVKDVQELDPDVLTGWNFLDFDFPRLAARAEKWGAPFALGRSGEEAKFFPGESGTGDGAW
ncbi:MAG: DNA polymerase II, partial [Spirochaetaceae bacterium]|nr:DNA polymerase II [Spirochaetaceae bacterium]